MCVCVGVYGKNETKYDLLIDNWLCKQKKTTNKQTNKSILGNNNNNNNDELW